MNKKKRDGRGRPPKYGEAMMDRVMAPLSKSQNILLEYGSDALSVSKAELIRELVELHLGDLIGEKLRECGPT